QTLRPAEDKTTVVGQTSSGGRVRDQTDPGCAFRPIKHPHQRRADVVTISDQLTKNRWLAQGKLEQAGHPLAVSASQRRHTVKSMSDLAHAALKSRARFVVPGGAVPA